jgi:hypothetical protein
MFSSLLFELDSTVFSGYRVANLGRLLPIAQGLGRAEDLGEEFS